MSARRQGLAVAASALGALGLLLRSGLGGGLSRDEAVYAYAGQRLAHGVPPYDSIFDPKGPGAVFVAGAGAVIGRLSGHSELTGIRVLFGLCAVAAVAAAAWLATTLWSSVAAGLVAAVSMCAFPALATDAFNGPDAKVPALSLVLVAMTLGVRRRWFWSALVGVLAAVVWQPLFILPLGTTVAAAFGEPAEVRRRCVARAALGAVVAVSGMLVYFVTTSTLRRAVDAAVRFPLTGIRHGQGSVSDRWAVFAHALQTGDPLRGAVLIAAGGAAVVRAMAASGVRAAVAQPVAWVVVAPGVALAAYCATDFQGYPDLLPLLPFAALGWGGLAAWLATRGRSFTMATGLAVVLALIGVSLTSTGTGGSLAKQRRQVQRVVALGGRGHSTMWAFGDPTPLVLTGRTNPDRFVYLSSGVAEWRLRTEGGLSAWVDDIRRVDPELAVIGGYGEGAAYRSLVTLLRSRHYRYVAVGPYAVYVRPTP